MEVTDVRVRKVDKEGKMKAIVSITFDEEFVIHDIKVIEGEKGLFIAMPSRKTTDGEYRDIAHPIRPPRESYFSRLFWRNTKRIPREKETKIFNLEGRKRIYEREKHFSFCSSRMLLGD